MLTLSNKCPKCHQTKVFQSSNLFTFRTNKMNKECTSCHLDFAKEPGFYWGAMFVSYALALLEGGIIYGICRLLGTETFDDINLYAVVAGILVFAPFNFRQSRLIWLSILS